ncbi:MAG: TetR/AcrR family transcriptional regulator [Humibacter sp.]
MVDTQRGRPRSAQARTAIIASTRRLLHEQGYERMTIEGIAADSGVGKPTIYRWWPSKAAVTAEALLAELVPAETVTVPNTGDIRRDLASWLTASSRYMDENRAMIRALIAVSLTDRAMAELLTARFETPVMAALEGRLGLAVDEGQARVGVETDAVAVLLMDALLISVLERRALTPPVLKGILNVVVQGLS